MASNSSSEYKMVADKIVSPDEDIIVQIVGGVYKDSITENNRYTVVSDLSAIGATPTSFNPQFTDATGTVAGFTVTASYTQVGKLCFFRVYVDFNGYTNLGTGQYQITLPFASVATMSTRDGTLHNTATASIYHIAGLVDIVDSTTVMKFYYSGSTTDLAWKYNTPVSWANNATHFDISGVYQTV